MTERLRRLWRCAPVREKSSKPLLCAVCRVANGRSTLARFGRKNRPEFSMILKSIEDLQESVGIPFVTRKNNGTAKCLPQRERCREGPAAHQNATAVQAMRHRLQVRE